MLKPKGILSLEVQNMWNLLCSAWHVPFFTDLLFPFNSLVKVRRWLYLLSKIKLIEETLECLVLSLDSSSVHLID